MASEKPAFEGWAILELMGHRKLGGLISEAAVGGAAFIRIDVVAEDGQPAATQFYAPAAVYCITPVHGGDGPRPGDHAVPPCEDEECWLKGDFYDRPGSLNDTDEP